MNTQQPQPKTAKATQAAARKAQEARADYLRERGWTCIPPEEIEDLLTRMSAYGVGGDWLSAYGG